MFYIEVGGCVFAHRSIDLYGSRQGSNLTGIYWL